MRFDERDAMSEKTIENRLRRQARTQGLRLAKSRCRTPEHHEYGTYWLLAAHTDVVVAWGHPSGFGMTLEEIEQALME
jgi:hypothetical protein